MASIPSLDPEQLSPLSLRRPAPGKGSKSALTATLSVAAHAAVLGALLALPLLSGDQLPEPAGEARAFFAPPLALAPPPPPPPPAHAAPRVEAPRPLPGNTFTAPVEIPEQIVPEAAIDLGVEGGTAGGVEGGVPGGVVGGIVGGLPEAPRPPLQPLRVGDVVKRPRKLKDVPPVYPPLAVSGGIEGVVILECVVDTRGHVQEARVLRGMPLLDQAALDAVRQWVYSTTLVDGVPMPVKMTVTVNFRLGLRG
jgi:periplasmic protein TonB